MSHYPNQELADLLFPDVITSVEDIYKKYPERSLPDGARVTRFAPSPTGFLHIGGLFTALVEERVAHQSGGTFFLRIEDTDKKREVDNGVAGIVSALNRFGIKIDEGFKDEHAMDGIYGPYLQSDRKEIYLTFIKHLIALGSAYPCFCTPEELEASRKSQEAQKVRPGYYGTWAVHRDMSIDRIKHSLEQGKSFVVRLKSTGNEHAKIPSIDLIKGDISVTENDQDAVLLKSDKLPVYHFAHVIDDYLMKTTDVIRGDEWLSTLPIHLQLFSAFGWQPPRYGHLSHILKSEGGNKRKLSKRKDPEASVDYYFKEGYPNRSLIEYLLNIANSSFEDWRKANPKVPYTDFEIKLGKLSKSGALFDLTKLDDISREVISTMTAEEMYAHILIWAQHHDAGFAKILETQTEYVLKILNIERTGDKPRKDIGKWSEAKEQIFYFFNELFTERVSKEKIVFPESLPSDPIKSVISEYKERYNSALTKDEWSADLKDFGVHHGFARDVKTFKQDPSQYKGHVGDVAMILRLALTSKGRTPDLYGLLQVMGPQRVQGRLAFTLSTL